MGKKSRSIVLDFNQVNLNSIFLDRDGDGLIDTVDLQIHLTPTCGKPEVLSAILNLTKAIGFESIGMTIPLVTKRMVRSPSFGNHLYIGLHDELKVISENHNKTIYSLKENNPQKLIELIQQFTLFLISKRGKISKRKIQERPLRQEGFNLFNFFSKEGLLRGSPNNPLEIFIPYKIILFSEFRIETATEAANFAARIGLESPHLSLPFAFSLSAKPECKWPFIFIGKKGDFEQLGFKQRIDDLLPVDWDSGIFLLPQKTKLPGVLICGEEPGIEKILRYLSTLPSDSKGVNDPVFNEVNRLVEDLKGFPEASSHNSPSMETLIRSYPIEDRRKEVLGTLKEALKECSLIKDSIDIGILMAEPEKRRRRFAGEIKHLLRSMGFAKEKIHLKVLNAYKPGLSWMKEVVLKEVSKKKADRIEIAFKPFNEKGLEESIRWLQEIYPIDEVFAKKLGIAQERVAFKMDSRIKEVYRVRAWRKKKKVYEAQFSPKWRTLYYLPMFPRSGKIHPCTGWVGVKAGKREILGREIKTSVERIWEIYQKEILPLIAKETDRVILKRKLPPKSPIFEEIRFDIFLNYPMETLKVNEERISPLEALHEDLYFVTLDFFSNYMKSKNVSNLSVGRILPVIHPHHLKRNGKLLFTLTHLSENPFSKIQPFKISFNGLAFRGSDALADLHIEPERSLSLERLKDSFSSLPNSVGSRYRIDRMFEEKRPRRRLRVIAVVFDLAQRKPVKHRKFKTPPDIPVERPISYREGVNLIRSFEGLLGVQVVDEGTSSGNLPIYSIEHTYPCPSPFVSHWKRLIFKPTFFINCRHHANEVSSTNAGLKLSRLLTTHPDYQRLLKKVNVVLNPMENVDGVVLLEEMLRWTPTDKLHAGRYNRAGQEYYSEYFNPNTPFGEARVKMAIWKRWLPDVCVDNHGFPSHEWEQPFSGYAPFRFREWWIPRTFFFFYLPFLEEKDGSLKRNRSEQLGKWIWDVLKKDRRIERWNQTFLNRYRKYRQQWMKPFHHWEDWKGWLPIQRRFRRTNLCYRSPRITTLDFITEVADEITYGKMLRDATSAHLKTNLAIITLLHSHPFLVKKKGYIGPEGIQLQWKRERPLHLFKR